MSFVQNYSVTLSVDVTTFTITDTSTGSDSGIAGRRIFLQKADGTYLVTSGTTTSYIDFPLSSSSITLTGILKQDYSLNITVLWVDINGNTLYSKVALYTFIGNGEQFLYNLGTKQVTTPNLLKDNNYLSNKFQLRLWMDDAVQANGYSDQVTAQQALDRAAFMITNQNLFF